MRHSIIKIGVSGQLHRSRKAPQNYLSSAGGHINCCCLCKLICNGWGEELKKKKTKPFRQTGDREVQHVYKHWWSPQHTLDSSIHNAVTRISLVASSATHQTQAHVLHIYRYIDTGVLLLLVLVKTNTPKPLSVAASWRSPGTKLSCYPLHQPLSLSLLLLLCPFVYVSPRKPLH